MIGGAEDLQAQAAPSSYSTLCEALADDIAIDGIAWREASLMRFDEAIVADEDMSPVAGLDADCTLLRLCAEICFIADVPCVDDPIDECLPEHGVDQNVTQAWKECRFSGEETANSKSFRLRESCNFGKAGPLGIPPGYAVQTSGEPQPGQPGSDGYESGEGPCPDEHPFTHGCAPTIVGVPGWQVALLTISDSNCQTNSTFIDPAIFEMMHDMLQFDYKSDMMVIPTSQTICASGSAESNLVAASTPGTDQGCTHTDPDWVEGLWPQPDPNDDDISPYDAYACMTYLPEGSAKSSGWPGGFDTEPGEHDYVIPGGPNSGSADCEWATSGGTCAAYWGIHEAIHLINITSSGAHMSDGAGYHLEPASIPGSSPIRHETRSIQFGTTFKFCYVDPEAGCVEGE